MSLFKEFQVETEEYDFPALDQGERPPRITEFCFKPLAYQEPGMEPTPEMIEEAQGIVGEAKKQAQHIERQAYEEGFSQGQKDGVEVGKRSLEQQIQQFQDLVAALTRDKEEIYRQREQELVEMVLLISRKIVARELTLQPDAIEEIVAAGFKLLSDSEGIKLHLNPKDCEFLELSPRDNWPPEVELMADGTISPGGFLLETATGEIDGTLENRWEVVAQMVQEVLKGVDEK